MANPFDAVQPPANPFDKVAAPDPAAFTPANAQRGKAVLASNVEHSLNALSPFAERAGQAVSPVINFLGRGLQGTERSIARNDQTDPNPWSIPGLNTPVDKIEQRALTGNISQEQTAADTGTLQKKFGITKLPSVMQGPATFLMQTAMDPSMYVTGPLTFLHDLMEANTLPAAMKLAAAAKMTPKLQKMASSLHDFFGVDSALKRYLASELGPDWINKYAGVYAVRAVKGSTKNMLEYAMGKRFREAIKGLSDDQERQIYLYLDGKAPQIAPDLMQRADSIKEVTDTDHYLKADQAAQANLQARGYQLPEWAKPFDPAVPRGIAKVGSYRPENVGSPGYVPAPRDYIPTPLEKPKVISGLNTNDPSQLHRDELPWDAFKDVSKVRQGFLDHIGSSANVIANHDAMTALREVFHLPEGDLPPDVMHTFQSTILPEHSQPNLAGWEAGMKSAQDVQKTGLFSLPFRHMLNILNLAAISGPETIVGGLKNYLKTALKNPEERAKFYAPAIQHGAVQMGTEGDRASSFSQALDTGGQALVDKAKSATGKSLGMAAGKGAVSLAGHALKFGGAWFRGVGDQLWKFDDAMKASQFDRNLAKGMSPDRAGLEVNASLVDYNTRSPFTDRLSAWAPFVTWRSKMPMAVGRSILRSPGNVNMLNRFFPQATGNITKNYPDNETSNLPVAEALQAVSPIANLPSVLADPTKSFGDKLTSGPEWKDFTDYARGTLGVPARLAGNALANAIVGNGPGSKYSKNFFTYGKPTGQFLESNIPFYGQTVQPLMGGGLFPGNPLDNLIYQHTGVHKTKAKPGKSLALKKKEKNPNPFDAVGGGP